MTAYSAWNRLFDETIASLRFKVGSKSLAIEPTLNLMQDTSAATRKAASQALAKTFKENLRTFALITNVLAKDKEISDRWRGYADVADARHLANRVEREVVETLVAAVRGAYPRLSHRYYALKARWFGKKRLAHWDRNAPLPKVPARTIGWGEAQATVLTAYGAFSPDMDRAAIGLGAVFLHLRAELNFHVLFNQAIEDFSIDRVARQQAAALAGAGLDA